VLAHRVRQLVELPIAALDRAHCSSIERHRQQSARPAGPQPLMRSKTAANPWPPPMHIVSRP
jgi:hypothetical protein